MAILTNLVILNQMLYCQLVNNMVNIGTYIKHNKIWSTGPNWSSFGLSVDVYGQFKVLHVFRKTSQERFELQMPYSKEK